MVHDSLAEQLRRIGLLPAIAITIAATLATFALLERFIPLASKSPLPGLVAPAGSALTPITTGPAHSHAGATQPDPLAASQASFERSISAAERRNVTVTRHQAQREARLLSVKPINRTLSPGSSPGRVKPTAPRNRPGPTGQPATSGGVSVGPPIHRKR